MFYSNFLGTALPVPPVADLYLFQANANRASFRVSRLPRLAGKRRQGRTGLKDLFGGENRDNTTNSDGHEGIITFLFAMMCEVMPTISESEGGGGRRGSGSPLQSDSEGHFESLMVSMLEERDRLLDTLRESQENLGLTQGKLHEVSHERDSLQRQLNTALPQLLLEHLECLVSRHERSLRMTVVKRQAQSPAGVSSELAYLREQSSQKRGLADGTSEVNHNSESTPSTNGKRSSDGSLSQDEESGHGFLKVGELQDVVDRQTADLGQMKERMVAMVSRINELEEDLDTARKDVIKSEDVNTRLQRDLREKDGHGGADHPLEKRYLAAQREATSVHDLNDKLENEVANKDSLFRQTEDRNRQLQEKLELAEQKLQQTLRKAETLPEVEAELAQRVAALTKGPIFRALAHVQFGSLSCTLLLNLHERLSTLFVLELAHSGSLKTRLEETLPFRAGDSPAQKRVSPPTRRSHLLVTLSTCSQHAELQRNATAMWRRETEAARGPAGGEEPGAAQGTAAREDDEEHNKRLSETVDKLLSESNERLQLHLKRGCLRWRTELEHTKKLIEESHHDKEQLLIQIETMRAESEQGRSRSNSLLHGRSQMGSTPDFRYPVSASSMMDSNSDHYGSALVLRRAAEGTHGSDEGRAVKGADVERAGVGAHAAS
ncbi:hypothetical protein KUCAC02_033980 [Chaenocephalus aceratus]|nr:hypothetical protein KUCAC02_033980 [Chaenocephalus aceratus]